MRRPRVLVFSSVLPLPVDRGDRNRLFHVLQLLADVAEVRVVAVDREWEPHVRDLSPLGGIEVQRVSVSAAEIMASGAVAALTGRPYIITRYALPRVRRLVRESIEAFRPDVYWGYQAASFPFLRDAAGARRVVDVVDSPSRYAEITRKEASVSWASRLAMTAQWRIAALEREAIRACEAAVVKSELDLAHVQGLLGADAPRLVRLDNCVPRTLLAQPWSGGRRAPAKLLFVGNLAYPPNAAAVRLLAAEILPLVRQRHPDAELLVSGARGEALARALGERPGVRFLGFVDDLAALYREASLLRVPVPLSGGVQYKLLEGLAVGTPTIVSRSSAEIAGVGHEREVLVADAPQEYAAAVDRLLGDEPLARRLSAGGRAFIERNHTWESKRGLIAQLVHAG